MKITQIISEVIFKYPHSFARRENPTFFPSSFRDQYEGPAADSPTYPIKKKKKGLKKPKDK